MMLNLEKIVKDFNLQPHPEGGYYRETYRSPMEIKNCCLASDFEGPRKTSTAIYFLLHSGTFSAFHKIKSDELWHHYHGIDVEIHILRKNGTHECKKLGMGVDGAEPFQWVERGDWFAARCSTSGFALMGCTVAPGFDFADFEMAQREELLKNYPQYKMIIEELCRD